MVAHLQRTAARCRENAQVALLASQGRATAAAQQLDAAARACEAAAHYLSLAPPKARAWAEHLIGDGSTTSRPSANSADRNKTTGGTGDIAERDSQGRTKRLTATFEDLEVAEDNEPPLITVARKAFEKFRKRHEKDEEERDLPEDPLEVEITVAETGEIADRRARRKGRGEARRAPPPRLRNRRRPHRAGQEPPGRHGRIRRPAVATRHPHHHHRPRRSHLRLPRQTPSTHRWSTSTSRTAGTRALDFDPAFDLRPLESTSRPGIPRSARVRSIRRNGRSPSGSLEEGWRIDARPADDTRRKVRRIPDAMVREEPRSSRGVIVEFKTPRSNKSSADQAEHERLASESGRARRRGVIDGRQIGLSEEDAERAFRRACGQPGSTVASDGSCDSR